MYDTKSERICKWTLLALIVLCSGGLFFTFLADSHHIMSYNPLFLYAWAADFLASIGLPLTICVFLGWIVSVVLPLAGWILLCFDKKIGRTFLLLIFVPALALGVIFALYSLLAMFFAKNFGTALITALSYVIMFAISGAVILLQHKWKGNTL